ncbi:MAG: glycosyltransferase [Symploca sp. SIO1B1]|nr:glycosyltransferase [Symploca sp. SIO1C2]NER94916.1 glycosyltransferase [Symploca sp. SIO1B1]
MPMTPLVSIAINNYNYGRFLPEAIDSALNQTYSPIEVIVVDDGSTDNSREVIASYGDKIIPVLKSNGGQASAFNAGFATSQGEIICFLDSDDTCLPEKVAEIVQALNDRQDLGWCFHPLQQVDDKGKPLPQENPYQGEVKEYDLRAHIRGGKLKDRLANLPSTSGLSFTRSHLQQILPMPEAKRIGLNDGYLEFTSIALNPGLILDKPLGQYRIHGANAYVRSKDKRVQARVMLLTGYWMRVKFPFLAKFSHKVFAGGMGMFWRAGGIEPECQEFAKKYLSSATLIEKLEINARALYYGLTL